MSKIAVYPGSFDPVTYGHLDIAKRATNIFDHLIIAVTNNQSKKTLFSIKERVEMIKTVTKQMSKVEVQSFDGLLVEFVKVHKAKVIIRGLRAVSDFEYELQMALMNRKLESAVDTVFLMPAEPYTYLSSSVVKEIMSKGGNAAQFLPLFVEQKLRQKFSLTKK
ncbi:MAG: pantetheine-phosphate adenylyltransferase [bacterium]|nr:pantetheine-phosphate adenylyltransferase [bacterium]MDD5354596.1 pantetheine-phosphate adenylyltransferase [bacterium]MDD5755989.1 pantetheine-phosphate adenylyltransferase [bacterium]